MTSHAHTTDDTSRISTRRAMLLGAAVLPGAAAAAPLASTSSPDAELIAPCCRHPALIVAFNTGNSDGSDSDPLWIAYAKFRDAIHDAQLQTLAGVRAKALVAKTEALRPDGTEDSDGTVAAHWSWDFVNDLLRLTGGAA